MRSRRIRKFRRFKRRIFKKKRFVRSVRRIAKTVGEVKFKSSNEDGGIAVVNTNGTSPSIIKVLPVSV